MKSEYFIAVEPTIEDLTIRVNELLEIGWYCQGGISVVSLGERGKYPGTLEYHQAMIRIIPDEDIDESELHAWLDVKETEESFISMTRF